MSDNLRSYIKKNREKFDTAEPSKDLWSKIDSKLEVKPNAIKSKWITNLKYFGFGASVLMIAIYFISQKITEPSSVALTQSTRDSALNSSGGWVKANQNSVENEEQAIGVNKDNGKEKPNLVETKSDGGSMTLTESSANNDTLKSSPELISENKIKSEEVSVPVKEEKTIVSATTNKRKKISIPAEPTEMNIFYSTLYDGSSLCSVVQAYKFTGKVNMDDESNFTGRRTLKTMPCSRLEDIQNVKAVWIKGKISKKITLSVKEGLKNIVLVKSDGRRISPVAISHYYKGLGVISDYSGKHFDLTFKDKLELVLFFKDAEPGDKIIIDETIETIVKN